MPPKKKATAAKKTAARAPKKPSATAVARAAKKAAEQEDLWKWIDEHDPLIDRTKTLTPAELFSGLSHPRFTLAGENGAREFDWSSFRSVVAARDASSPRWFVQLREEDLLCGTAMNTEGVKMDCFVVAEAAGPTMAPAEYVVRVHYPFSDVEDNAPERVRPLAEQGVCWREVRKEDGSPTNMFFLQRRETKQFSFGQSSSSSAPPASSTTTTTTSAVPAGFGFGFGSSGSPTEKEAATKTPHNTPVTGVPVAFSFGTAAPSAASSAAPFGSGGSTAFSFGGSTAPVSSFSPPPAVPPPSSKPAPTATGSGTDDDFPPVVEVKHEEVSAAAALAVSSLKAKELNFVLWSRKRLRDLQKEILSGSRIVLRDFPVKGVKLQVQNDRTEDPDVSARDFLLSAFFAKRCPPVAALDAWIDACPSEEVGDHDEEALESLMGAMDAVQDCRRQLLASCADDSETFAEIERRYGAAVREELSYVIRVRRAAAQEDLDRIEAILAQMAEKKLLEKSSFRLLKYYPKNDVMPFRPTSKISGITEAGEHADECTPPPPVLFNPFTSSSSSA